MIALDSIDWNELTDAYGPAVEVPVLLSQLQSSTGHAFARALDDLYSRILHQGTLYTASPAATVILLQLLPNVTANERLGVYGILEGLAASARYSLRPGHVHNPCCAGGEPQVALAIRRELESCRDLFEGARTDPNEEIRRAATHLCLAFDAAPAPVLDRLLERYSSEASPHVRRELLLGALRSRSAHPNWADFLQATLRIEREPANRFLLRYGQILHQGPAATEEIVDEMTKTMVAAVDSDYVPSALEGTELTWFLEGLASLQPEAHFEALRHALTLSQKDGLALALARHLLTLTFHDEREGWGVSYSVARTGPTPPKQPGAGSIILRIFWALIRSLFLLLRLKVLGPPSRTSRPKGLRLIEYWGMKGPAPTMPDRLTRLQRLALETIANHPPLWRFKTNLWSLYQLPDSPEALRAFLQTAS